MTTNNKDAFKSAGNPNRMGPVDSSGNPARITPAAPARAPSYPSGDGERRRSGALSSLNGRGLSL
jgi:hypothetical protein